MPLTRHRLDMVLVPRRPEEPLNRGSWASLHERWQDRGWILGDAPGPAVEALISGGFRRCWLDEPGRLHLYANHQGGYRVYCGVCRKLLTGHFVTALTAARVGKGRQLSCPDCGADQTLESLEFRPPAAFAHWGLVLADVEALDLETEAMEEAESALGSLRVILRRVG